MSDLILNAQRLYRRVMGEEAPSSLTANRCHSNGDLAFLTKPYRCVAAANQLINVRNILPKATFLYSDMSPEDAYESGTQVTIMWEEEGWNVNTPMVISDNGWCYFYVDSDAFDSVDDGYYLTTSGSTRTYYYVEYGVVLEVGQYVPTGGIVADLQNMWMRGPSYDLSGLYAFKSQAHKGVESSMDVMTIEVTGTSTFTCYIRSWGEHIGSSVYDYVMITNPNVSYPTSSLNYQSADVKAHTKNEYNTGGTSLSDYQAVTFTGLNPNTANTIYVVYKKDFSDSPQYVENDEGYILLPDTVTFVNPYAPAPTSDIYLKYHGTVGTGDNFETINADDTYIYPGLTAVGAWTITCDKPWITPMSGFPWHGNSAVSDSAIWCNVEPNTTGAPRTAILTASLDGTPKLGIYTVTQLG